MIKNKSSRKEVASVYKAEGAYHIRLVGDVKVWRSFKLEKANAMEEAMQALCTHLQLPHKNVQLSLDTT